MGVAAEDLLLEMRRSVLADNQIVAYSYDLLPLALFPPHVSPDVTGSILSFLRRRLHVDPTSAIAEIHAVSSSHIGWGPESGNHALYVLLDPTTPR